MPLFEAIERDIAAFFVSQGTIFDSMLKAVLERIAHVETKVESHAQIVNTLVAFASSAQAPAPSLDAQADVSSADESARTSRDGDDLERHVMMLSRQLNIVLALLLQPFAIDTIDAVRRRHEAQQPTIVDVLTENESILTSYSATLATETASVRSLTGASLPTTNDSSSPPTTITQPLEPSESKSDVLVVSAAPSTVIDASSVAATTSQHTARDPEEADEADAETEVEVDAEPGGTATGKTRSRRRKRSTLALVHDLHASEERRQRHDAEWRRHVQQLLDASQAQWRLQHDELARALQTQQDEAWRQRQQQDELSLRAVETQLEQQQRALDQQFLTFSNTFLAAQTAQEQQLAHVLESLREQVDAFVSRGELEQLAASWLQTARDDCVFGANAETLATLQQDLARLRDMLLGNGERATESPVLAQLKQEIARVLELLRRILELLERDANGLHSLTGGQLMQTLHVMLGQLEELAHHARDDHVAAEQSAALLSEMTRRMEMGTASLLHALETQQEQYQRALTQQQTAIEALQRDALEQRASATELRQQLAACPSQEDTLRVIAALREQIQTSTADTTSRMLDTVDDLRVKLNGLPTLEFLDKLLHSKADRSEIDRLRLLLASAATPATPSGPSLAKSPTRCLSCDQSLPFMHSRPPSARLSALASEHPSTALDAASIHAVADGRQSRSASPPRQNKRATSPVASSPAPATWPASHIHEHDAPSNQFADTAFARAMAETGDDDAALSTQDILNDLARSIAAAKRRRMRQQLHAVAMQGPSTASEASTPMKRRSLVPTDEDRRNRIPLRRPTLSDQVIYGPTITSGFLKPRKSMSQQQQGTTNNPTTRNASAAGESSNEPRATARPKTAVVPERRGGDVILRAPTTTVVVRPFSELSPQQRNTTPRASRQ